MAGALFGALVGAVGGVFIGAVVGIVCRKENTLSETVSFIYPAIYSCEVKTLAVTAPSKPAVFVLETHAALQKA